MACGTGWQGMQMPGPPPKYLPLATTYHLGAGLLFQWVLHHGCLSSLTPGTMAKALVLPTNLERASLRQYMILCCGLDLASMAEQGDTGR